MRVEVRGHGLEVSESIREHVERRLRFALDRFRDRVEGAYASLSDLNGGNRGGVDRHCRIVILLRPSGSVAAHARRADLHDAIDVAAGAAGRALVREVSRRRTRSRLPPRPPGPRGPARLRSAS